MTDKPTVSVVIPCYNAAPFLRETLDSAINQTYPPLEILVIDDGSTDNSAAIAESYGPPVRVIRQPNQGESVARNRGIDEAKGEWIAFLDADDVWLPERIQVQLENCPRDAVAAHSNLEVFGSDSYSTNIAYRPSPDRYDLARLCINNSFLTPSAFMVRRIDCPRFPESTRLAEDLVFILELVQRGRIAFVCQPLVRYRRHQRSQSADPANIVGVFKTIEGWLAKNHDLIDADTATLIRNHWLDVFTDRAWKLKESRNWPLYWSFRRFLQQYSDYPPVKLLLSNRIYPQLLYKVKDSMKRFYLGLPPQTSTRN